MSLGACCVCPSLPSRKNGHLFLPAKFHASSYWQTNPKLYRERDSCLEQLGGDAAEIT